VDEEEEGVNNEFWDDRQNGTTTSERHVDQEEGHNPSLR